ncbi:sperm protein associated with the nucleus on the X chromosome N1 [Symphalangus syndactylus]|uniref:sperm protein associated with the nucleus on the X chromosome N1 n=1 Tax=Symphalangus syndactylus TaxID=9590 RepID=UPI0024420309|nr:sperm protein associated with the nucleus on the X chromosome N1 [Symphalangus syndactylus]
MDSKPPSTNGEKRKSPCESDDENDEMQETPNRGSAPEPTLKKMKTSEYSTLLVVRYRKFKKIYSNRREKDQSPEHSINPAQEEEDEVLEISAETSAKEEEDP